MLANFVGAILRGEPLIARAEEGIHSVELANAMLASSLQGKQIRLPLDAADYEARLQERIAKSTYVKPEVQVVEIGDFSKSFAR